MYYRFHAAQPKRMSSFLVHILVVCLLCGVLCLNLWGTVTPVYGSIYPSSSTISVTAPEAICYCVETGEYVYEKDADTTIYPASTTKLLTAIIALEEGDLDQMITVSSNAVYGIDSSSSHIALQVGEEITLEEALYGLLLCSANDCAVAIAEAIAGSVEAFADMMNEKAAEIGCTGSHFTNPHGLYDDDHYTTVRDLVKIMNYCYANDTFVEISSTLVYELRETNLVEARQLWNNHRMLKNKYAYYEPVICGKSGYITESGCNLVTVANQDGMTYIVAVAGDTNATLCCTDTRTIFEYFYANYSLYEGSVAEAASSSVEIRGQEVDLDLSDSFQLLLPTGYTEADLTYTTTLQEDATLPVSQGDTVATFTISLGGEELLTMDLTAASNVNTKLMTFLGKVVRIGSFVLLGFLLLLSLLIINAKRRKRQRQKQLEKKKKARYN